MSSRLSTLQEENVDLSSQLEALRVEKKRTEDEKTSAEKKHEELLEQFSSLEFTLLRHQRTAAEEKKRMERTITWYKRMARKEQEKAQKRQQSSSENFEIEQLQAQSE